MTGEISDAMIEIRKKCVLIFTIRVQAMSFVISNTQHLAPTETRAKYAPLVFEEEGFRIRRLDVSFGHPLYTSVADIFYVKCTADEKCILPVIPDGCMAMVLWGNEDRIGAHMCGVTDEIKKIYASPGDNYIFIRFLPGTGYSLVKKAGTAGSLANKAIPLKGNVLGGEQILSVLNRETQLDERVRLISKIIRVHLQGEQSKYLIKYCTERIFQSQGMIKVEELAEETGFTSRHIGKLFERCIGISPKLYAQIIRLQTSMRIIMEEREKLLMEIAVDSGFFDHAHMNRMYKKMIHRSSGDFRKKLFTGMDYEQIDDYISVNSSL